MCTQLLCLTSAAVLSDVVVTAHFTGWEGLGRSMCDLRSELSIEALILARLELQRW